MNTIFFTIFTLLLTKLTATIYLEPTSKFNSSREIAAVYIEYEGQILLLHRQNTISEGNKWGPPAGHVEKGETPLEAAIREFEEETGYNISNHVVEHFKTLYIEYDDKNHFYFICFELTFKVILEP